MSMYNQSSKNSFFFYLKITRIMNNLFCYSVQVIRVNTAHVLRAVQVLAICAHVIQVI